MLSRVGMVVNVVASYSVFVFVLFLFRCIDWYYDVKRPAAAKKTTNGKSCNMMFTTSAVWLPVASYVSSLTRRMSTMPLCVALHTPFSCL